MQQLLAFSSPIGWLPTLISITPKNYVQRIISIFGYFSSLDLSNDKSKSFMAIQNIGSPKDFLLQTENFQDLELNQGKVQKGRSLPRLSLRNNLDKDEMDRKRKAESIKYLGEIRERFIPDMNDVNDPDCQDSLFQRFEKLKKVSPIK
jgi:hypothetical protein